MVEAVPRLHSKAFDFKPLAGFVDRKCQQKCQQNAAELSACS